MKKRISGTREWACKTANCILGCSHDCRYCYAKEMAIRFKRKTPDTWKQEIIFGNGINQVCKGKPTRVMFPSTHDITPAVLPICLEALGRMLAYGHEILIVSKPHMECIQVICDRFAACRDRILFRFTIGSRDDAVLKFWEPNAPLFEERLSCLRFACNSGFRTSVSCEPMLDDNIETVVKAFSPVVTDTIWIGKANNLRQRLRINGANEDTIRKGNELIAMQHDEAILGLYSRLKDNSRIRWKDSIRAVIGIGNPIIP